MLLGTVAAATAIVFCIVQIVPGDPVRYMMGLQADPGAMDVIRHELGLDAAPLQRYLRWITGLLRGDFTRLAAHNFCEPEQISAATDGELLACLDGDKRKLAIVREAGVAVAARRAQQIKTTTPILQAYVA